MVEKIKVLPPRPGVCKLCAARHAADQPHERDSLYYQVKFYRRFRRFPTWEDAMNHCSEETKRAKRAELSAHTALNGPSSGNAD